MKAYWEAVSKKDDKAYGCSLRPVTKERFLFELSETHPSRIYKGYLLEAREISEEAWKGIVAGSPKWVKDLVELRRKAEANVISTPGTVYPLGQQATLEGWVVSLTLDVTEGHPMFHLSAQSQRREFPSKRRERMKLLAEDMMALGRVLVGLGAIPVPNPMGDGPSPIGVFHFRWPADVDVPGAAPKRADA